MHSINGTYCISFSFNSSVQEKSLLVMENLFYECEIANKFDLKGSDRNRLVDPTNQNGEIVLLDENLIQSKRKLNVESLEHFDLFYLFSSVLVETAVHSVAQ